MKILNHPEATVDDLISASMYYEANKKKIYTCHFDSVKVGKKVLKNLNFASINKKEWIGIDSNNLTISDYNKLKSMVTPAKHSDGRITGNMLVSIITIVDLAHKSKKPLVIKEVV